MTNNKILYGLALVAGAAVAVWAGLPPIFLLFLACPVGMMLMMGGMHGGHDAHDDREATGGRDNAPRPTHVDGHHDRI